MSFYYSVRGWLEFEHEHFDAVLDALRTLQKEVLSDPKVNLYPSGWCWSKQPLNWTRYIFYGADVQAEGLDYFATALERISQLKLHVSGYFRAMGEDEIQNITYTMTDDVIDTKKEP